MAGSTVAALMAKYSRYPAGSQTVRAATAHFDIPVDFVVLDSERALIIASGDGTVLVPRQLSPAEQAVLASGQVERTSTSTSVPVAVADDLHVALSAPIGLDPIGVTKLQGFASKLSADIVIAQAEREQPQGFASAVLAGMRDSVLVLDADLSVSWCSDGVVTGFGWAPDELIGGSFVDLIHPDDLQRAIDAAASLAGGHRIFRLTLRIANAFGGHTPASITGFDHTADPVVNGIVVSLRTDERELETEQALDETRRLSTTILQNLQEAVIATDDAGSITIINDAARRLFSVPADVPPGMLSIADIKLLDENQIVLPAGAHPLRPNPLSIDQSLCVETPGELRFVTVSRSKVSFDDDRFGIVVTFLDTTRARATAHELRSQAMHDQLTGLANRHSVSEQVSTLQAVTTDLTLAACSVGIDKFKNVNDVHGHSVGDAVLRETASRLRAHIRDNDILARPSADEFLLILVNPANNQHVLDLAERIRSDFDRPFEIDGNRLHLTASVGVAFQQHGNLDEALLVQQADIALYAAKDHGRDRIELFDQELATIVARGQSQRNMVRDALDNDRLVMHFQPIVNSAGETIGAEALARCIDEAGNVIEPAGFMDAIDGTNLLVRLDRAGFEQSCRLAAILKQNPATEHMWVAANFSATTLAQSDFAEVVLSTMKQTGVGPKSICIEVTETAAFDPGESSIKALTGLYDAGLGIALDDFGTGYSSLSHLRDLPLTTVKIDRSFTSELRNHGAERAIASAVKDIAESLGFNVVAEGVETADDRAAVQDIGVDSMQGWFFARAVPQAELLYDLRLNSLKPTTD